MEARLHAIAPFQVTEAIGTWVGNTCSILSKDSHWETVEDLSALPKEQKPIWLPYKKALKWLLSFAGKTSWNCRQYLT
jgi:hypothetical protein